MKLSKFRVLLYIFLLALVFTSLVYWQVKSTSLGENLVASAVEIFITVGIIDLFIRQDRLKQFREINQEKSQYFKVFITLSVLRIGTAVGYKPKSESESPLDVTDYSNEELKQFVERIKSSKQYKTYLSNLRLAKRSARKKSQKIDEQLEKEYEQIRDSLKDFVPYVDPAVTKRLSEVAAQSRGSFAVIDTLLTGIDVELPKKGHKKVREDDEFWPGFLIIWQKTVIDRVHTNHGTFEQVMDEIFDLFIFLHEKAEQNKMHLIP